MYQKRPATVERLGIRLSGSIFQRGRNSHAKSIGINIVRNSKEKKFPREFLKNPPSSRKTRRQPLVSYVSDILPKPGHGVFSCPVRAGKNSEITNRSFVSYHVMPLNWGANRPSPGF
jgi:hypothetical protein